MTIELFANDPGMTLGASITTTPTAGTVETNWSFTFPAGASLTAPGTTGQYRIAVEQEIVLWTAGTVTAGGTSTGNTVTRGAEGTTPATHSAGVACVPDLTAGNTTQLSQQGESSTGIFVGGRIEPLPRWAVTGSFATPVNGNGNAQLATFIAPITTTVSRFCCVPVAWSSTNETFIGMALYLVNSDGSLTLAAQSGNNITTNAPTANSIWQPPITADGAGTAITGYQVMRGQHYAVGVGTLGTGSAVQFVNCPVQNVMSSIAPFVCGHISLTSSGFPASVAAGSTYFDSTLFWLCVAQ